MKPTFSIENLNERLPGEFDAVSKQAIRVMSTFTHHFEKIGRQHANRWLGYSQQWFDAQQHLAQSAESGQAQQEAIDYAVDSAQRTVLTLDVLRERGNQDKAHQDAGTPPVLIYDYDVIMDGHDFARPANYLLLKILPPAGVEVFDWKRPYMIIDPRAGHPVDNAVLAAVVLPSATETDALSTALLVVGAEGHEKIAQLRPRMKTLVVGAGATNFRADSNGIALKMRESVEKPHGNG